VQGYNCSGQGIQAQRLGPGDYEVKFLGNGSAIALGNMEPPSGVLDAGSVSIVRRGFGDFEVLVYNPNAASVTHLDDVPFVLLTP
jgi:hypothetical protein